MGVDGGDYSLRGKRSVGFGGDVCRAGFLCETARGDFRFGGSIKNGARQGRAPLRAVARTRTPAECPVSLEDQVRQLGSVPLPVVTARIDRFIAEGGKGPY